MKKYIGLFLLSVSVFLLISCNSQTNFNESENNSNLIEAVKEIERLDHQFSNYFLSYDEYISSLKSLDIKFNTSIDDEVHYNRKYVPEPIDLKNLDKEQLYELRKTQENLCDVKVEITKVFDYENKKYIFTKSTISPEGNSVPGFYITKRYRITNNNGEYEIEYIDIGMYDIDTPEENLKYNKFNNELVEYREQFNL
ncbi:hypothetical protein [Brassicibacter mesophilus]|uniref:hypothetical protein n=1 Tax=Brassicibacter mesophilus TaxID=745119 RepID=UPI003D24C8BA